MTATTDTLRSPASFFDALAADYDRMTDVDARLVRERPFVHVLIDRYDVHTALDAGTGTGVHAILLARLGVRVTAVDVSDEMLRHARLNASRHRVRLRTLRADLSRLDEVLTGSFDAVFCLGNTLAHLHDRDALDRVLSGFHRLVHRDGVCVLQVLNYGRIAVDREVVLSTRERDGVTYVRSYRPSGSLLAFRTTVRRGERVDEQSVLHRPWRPDELEAAVTAAGFAAVTRYGGIDLKPFDEATSNDLILIATPTPA